MLDLNISKHLALYDLINSIEDVDDTFNVCSIEDHKDENELYITLNALKVEHAVQNLHLGLYKDSNQTSMPIFKPTMAECGYK